MSIGGYIKGYGRAISVFGNETYNDNSIYTKQGEAIYINGNIEANSNIKATNSNIEDNPTI